MPTGKDSSFDSGSETGTTDNASFTSGFSNFGQSIGTSPTEVALGRLGAVGIDPRRQTQPWSVQTGWQQRLLDAAKGAQGLARNPYDENYANQNRAAQMALLAQMRAQQAGPSLAGLQGQRGMSQSGQAALAQAAMGGPARAAMMQAQSQGGGMANDIGQARLAEIMRMQAGQGGLASSIRGGDQQSALQSAAAQLRAQGIQDDAYRFYTGLGARSVMDDARYGLDRNRLIQQTARGAEADKAQAQNDVMQTAAAILGMLSKSSM